MESDSTLQIPFVNWAPQKCIMSQAEINQIDFPLVASTVKFDTYIDEIIKS
jgi:hypothetical protein